MSSPVRVLVPVFFAVAACASPPPKPAESPKPPAAPTPSAQGSALRPQVESVLSGYERTPTAEDFEGLGPEAFTALDAIYRDSKMLPTRRLRAVSAMGLVKNPAATQALRGIVTDANAEPMYRAKAALALAHREGAAAVPDLRPLLSHENTELREAAARALGQAGTPEARQLLEERLAQEQDVAVRESIQHSLTKAQP